MIYIERFGLLLNTKDQEAIWGSESTTRFYLSFPTTATRSAAMLVFRLKTINHAQVMEYLGNRPLEGVLRDLQRAGLTPKTASENCV